MLTENLKIYRTTFELTKVALAHQNDVAKVVRYGVYSDMVRILFDAMDLIYIANSDRRNRVASLCRYIELLGGVRSRVRLLGEGRYLSLRTQDRMAGMLAECLKQAAGWRNATQGESPQGMFQTESAASIIDKEHTLSTMNMEKLRTR